MIDNEERFNVNDRETKAILFVYSCLRIIISAEGGKWIKWTY